MNIGLNRNGMYLWQDWFVFHLISRVLFVPPIISPGPTSPLLSEETTAWRDEKSEVLSVNVDIVIYVCSNKAFSPYNR